MSNDRRKTNAQLIEELQELRRRVAKLDTAESPVPSGTRASGPSAGAFEADVRTVLESLAEGVLFLDAQGVVQSANAAALILLGGDPASPGFERTHHILRSDGSRFPLDEQPGMVALRTGRPLREVEMGVQRTDGTIRWMLANSQPIREAHGTVVGAVVSLSDITERKRAGAALREVQERDRMILVTAMDGFWALDAEGRLIEVNDAYCRMSGYSTEELLGMSVRNLEAVESGTEIIEHIRKVESKGYDRFETRHRRKDGREFDVEVSVQRSHGSNTAMVAFLRDISLKKKAERELVYSRDLMRYIIEHNRSAVAVHDREMKYIYVSQRYLDEYKVKERDVIGRHHYDVFPDLPQKWRDVHQRVLKGEVLSAEDDAYVREDGSTDWTRWECRPWYESDGAIGGLIVYTEVITERKRMEQSLREQNELLQNIVHNIPVMVAFFDAGGAFKFVNRQLVKDLGWTLDEIQRCPDIMAELYPDPVARSTAARFMREAPREWMPFKTRTRQGEIIDTCWTNVRLSDGRLIGIGQNVSEQKQMEERLRQAQKLESVGQLAGGVAHDFNNILASMMLHLDYLLEGEHLDVKTRGSLGELLRDAERAASLTRQLLMFSRRSLLEVKVLDLNELVANLLKMLGRLIGEHIRLVFERKDGLPSVDADPGMIEQVLVNLAVNARDAMPRGGTLTISTDAVEIDEERARANPAVRPGAFVCISVADNGCGMDEATVNRIFEPFFTTKEIGRGTGLGLSTVYGILAQHQGLVEVESGVGKGSTFRILFPATTRTAVKPDRKGKTKAVRGHETILLAEDESRLREVTARILMRLGYRVLQASNGQEAFRLWQEADRQIDLLLSDMVMPGEMTGLELAHKLRSEKPGLKVIIASGYSAEMSERGKLTAEGIVFLPKPFQVEVMSKTIRYCLDH